MVWFEKYKALFCRTFVKKKRRTYNTFQWISAVFMAMTLLWLTVSNPFVSFVQQELAKQHKMENARSPLSNNEEEAAKPVGNTSEEKAPSGGSSLSEEYLHENHLADYFFYTIKHSYKCESEGTYVAYHGELLVPPPNGSIIV